MLRKVPASSLEAEEQLLAQHPLDHPPAVPSLSLPEEQHPGDGVLLPGPKLSSPFCTAQGEYRLSPEGNAEQGGNSASES